MPLGEAKSCPGWVVPNAGATGYYRSELSESLMKALWKDAPLSVQEELVLAKDVQALVFAGREPIETMLALVPTMAKSDDEGVVITATELANLGRLVRGDRSSYQKWLAKNFGAQAKALGWKAARNELPVRKSLREALLSLMIFEGQDVELRKQGQALAAKWLADPSSVDPDLAGLALRVGARWGDSRVFASYLVAIKGSDSRSRRRLLFTALGAHVEPSELAQALTVVLDKSIDVRESSRILTALAEQHETSAQAFDFVVENFDLLAKRFGDEMKLRLARIVSQQCGEEQEAAIELFLNDKIAAMEGGKKAAKKSLEAYRLCTAAQVAITVPSL